MFFAAFVYRVKHTVFCFSALSVAPLLVLVSSLSLLTSCNVTFSCAVTECSGVVLT